MSKVMVKHYQLNQLIEETTVDEPFSLTDVVKEVGSDPFHWIWASFGSTLIFKCEATKEAIIVFPKV